MIIKILSTTSKSFWYSDRIGGELYVDYNIESVGNPFIYTKNHHYIRSSDSVITELPESFCVKRCDENNRDDWNKYLVWLNKQKNYSIPVFGGVDRYKYYGVIGEKLHSDYLYPFGTEIHLDDMIKHIDYMESQQHIKGGEEFNKESQLTVKMNTQKISRQGLKEIYSVACDEWQGRIKCFGYRNPLEDYIDLTEDEVNEMFFASNEKQKSILSKYLKQDDGPIDVCNFNISDNNVLEIRNRGEYENKSFWLSKQYIWEIKQDILGQLCLIPTKKK